VDEGEIVTSAGVSAGIDMALHVIRRQHGAEIARATARDMEYDWHG
jgi:transcriptional regulator GlxA family with amidase domain